ncbi:carboxylate-amine ligase [Motilibacter rhizosphaerae]|uniref:Putative glutamate--cysteine ligase 2 n=1 Tax=Motilibacter rhizosphaerae TaxID=598652 RepID=A0A4Q7NPQ1_9ACTN|nr:glutamate--cysteine ligase [Motilibacter rhizosphaerae]RZS87163.1 carboxylate-amine ligase [Motilibacter rhizosphaerae]
MPVQQDEREPVSSAVGATFGVEEEFHVVDATSLAPLDSPGLAEDLQQGRWGSTVHPEISTAQIEVTTGVCTSLEQVRREVLAGRAAARAACAEHGAAPLPASTHPELHWEDQRLTGQARYLDLFDRWGPMALQQTICGCHVHVGVPDLDTAVAVMDRVRPWLPVLVALTGSSPFHEGADTGHESWRTTWWSRWPISGPPELLGDAEGYRRAVEELVGAGVVDDAHGLYWDVRPSARYPTLEFRVGDVCTRVDDVVLHAALCGSLTRVLAAHAREGRPVPQLRPELARAARWTAARHGLRGPLLDPLAGVPVAPDTAVGALLALLRDDLEDHGTWPEVEATTTALLARGTSAAAQRERVRRTGSLREAVAWALRTGSEG